MLGWLLLQLLLLLLLLLNFKMECAVQNSTTYRQLL